MNTPVTRPRVLLAEDNTDHAFLTARAFHDAHGDEVEMRTVTDGVQLLDYLNQRGDFAGAPRPHLVVLDLRMPKKSGLEALSEIQAHEDLRHIPVVVLSSSDRPEDVAASYELGANSYVTKPTTAAGMREGVGELARYWIEVATLPVSN